MPNSNITNNAVIDKSITFKKPIAIGAIGTIIVAVLHFLIVMNYGKNQDELQAIGQILGSMISGFAFVWLIVSQFFVLVSINHQQKALSLQESALQNQMDGIEKAQEQYVSQLFVTTLEFSISSLSRYCDSIISISRIDVQNDIRVNFFDRKDKVAIAIMRNNEILNFIDENRKSPILSDVISSYLLLYEKIRKMSEESDTKLGLFDVILKNSAFDHLATFLKKN